MGVTLITTADDRYYIPLITLLKSIELNLRTALPGRIYVIDAGLKLRHKREIERCLDGDRLRVVWLPSPSISALEGVPVFGHVNISTYFRLLVPEILAAEKKSIYIDADIVVLGDLGELWDTPMQGCPLLAVPFAFSHHLEDSLGTVEAGAIPGFRELGIPRDSRMMNGGLLVMDLDRWRRENYSRQIFEYLRKYHDSIRFWDQDGLNAILAGKWGGLPAKWNYCVDCGQPARQVDEGYLENLEQEASVVHFASSKKPWHYYCDHPAKEVFFGYLDKTPESGWRPFPPWRVFMNPHFWGQQVRKIPVIGPLWSIWRRGGTSSR